jgi:predicted ATP-dependent serine protease
MQHFPRPAISLDKLARKKFVLIPFEGEMQNLIGTPECSGSWIIYGGSGEGKTTFSLRLMKYWTKFKKCAYLPLEEGTKLTFKQAISSANLLSVSSKVKIWDEYTVQDLDIELKKPKAPEVVFIDSLQYLKMTAKSVNQLTNFEYMNLLKRHPKKLFIFISHAKKGEPKGALAEAVYYGSDVCLYVNDFMVSPVKSRYGGNTTLTL